MTIGVFKASLSIAILVLTAGCMVGPDFVRPETATADAWLEASDPKVTSAAVVDADWWRVFEDPILDRLIADAHRQNLPLQIAAVRVLEARAGLGVGDAVVDHHGHFCVEAALQLPLGAFHGRHIVRQVDVDAVRHRDRLPPNT